MIDDCLKFEGTSSNVYINTSNTATTSTSTSTSSDSLVGVVVEAYVNSTQQSSARAFTALAAQYYTIPQYTASSTTNMNTCSVSISSDIDVAAGGGGSAAAIDTNRFGMIMI